MNPYFSTLATIALIIAFGFLIKQLMKLNNIKKENQNSIIMLLGIALIIAFVFFFQSLISYSRIDIWSGNEVELLKTNKSLNVVLQPFYNSVFNIFKKNETFEFFNIFIITLFFMIYFKLMELFKSNRGIVLSILVILIPLTQIYFINSVEDSVFAIGVILFLSGLYLNKNNYSLIGALIAILFKEWLALSLIMFAALDFMNITFFRIQFELVYSIFLILFILYIASIYSFTDVIRYTFPFLAFYLLIAFKEMRD